MTSRLVAALTGPEPLQPADLLAVQRGGLEPGEVLFAVCEDGPAVAEWWCVQSGRRVRLVLRPRADAPADLLTVEVGTARPGRGTADVFDGTGRPVGALVAGTGGVLAPPIELRGADGALLAVLKEHGVKRRLPDRSAELKTAMQPTGRNQQPRATCRLTVHRPVEQPVAALLVAAQAAAVVWSGRASCWPGTPLPKQQQNVLTVLADILSGLN
jgi:hypothetical protein